MNKVILTGRMVEDPELKTTPGGKSVTTFRIAVNRWGTKEGQQTADFINIVAWEKTAENICRFFTKGRPILIEGSIQVRSYENKDGQKRTAFEVLANTFEFLESKNAASGGNGSYGGDSKASSAGQSPAKSGGFEDFVDIGDDGDLPF